VSTEATLHDFVWGNGGNV